MMFLKFWFNVSVLNDRRKILHILHTFTFSCNLFLSPFNIFSYFSSIFPGVLISYISKILQQVIKNVYY